MSLWDRKKNDVGATMNTKHFKLSILLLVFVLICLMLMAVRCDPGPLGGPVAATAYEKTAEAADSIFETQWEGRTK
jgi:hypothetical protein